MFSYGGLTFRASFFFICVGAASFLNGQSNGVFDVHKCSGFMYSFFVEERGVTRSLVFVVYFVVTFLDTPFVLRAKRMTMGLPFLSFSEEGNNRFWFCYARIYTFLCTQPLASKSGMRKLCSKRDLFALSAVEKCRSERQSTYVSFYVL